jgi:hypothetical protein
MNMAISKEIVQKTPPPLKKKGMKDGSKPVKGDQEQEAKGMTSQIRRNPNPPKLQKRRTASES